MADRRTIDPSLLDIVPWSHGFAHSWALGALLTDEQLADSILRVAGMPGETPLRVEGEVRGERPISRSRADLAFSVTDATGRLHEVAVETKVNDPYRPGQIETYLAGGHTPILYLPGLTGLALKTAEPLTGELRLYGRDLIAAVDDSRVELGAMLGGYMDALRAEADRMELAQAVSRGDTVEPVPSGRC